MNSRAIARKAWFAGPIIGFVFASVVALVVTVWEWIENPGGIFRGSSGTAWSFIYDTAASWFLPTFIYASVIASIAVVALDGVSLIYRNRTKKDGS
jgi:hypothetical protein